jgi:hypothetical protein
MHKTDTETDAIQRINKNKAALRGDDAIKSPAVMGSALVGSDAASPTPSNDKIAITQVELKALVDGASAQKTDAIAKELKAAQEQIDKLKQESESNQSRLQRELEEEKSQRDRLAKVFTDFGYAVPFSDSTYISSRASFSGDDIAKEFIKILESRDSTPSKVWTSPFTGETFRGKDTRRAGKFFKEHRESLRDGMEAFARKNGFLRGDSDAATTRSDVPPAFLDYLSMFLRISHSPKFIFHQFANRKLEIGKGIGDVIQVPRVAYAETGSASSDWELTPGTPIVSQNQPITASAVSITLKEYGMGKSNTLRPIGIPEFIMSNSLLDLEAALQRNLGHNYYEFVDISLRSLWLATTRVVYNKKNSVVTSAASVAAGDNGTATYKFLNALYAYMCGLQIPAYMNGKYGLVLHSTALAQLKNDLASQNQYLTQQNLGDVTNIFNAATQTEMDRVSGYEGDIANFMIFSTNAISLGAAGTPGAQTETIGGAANTTRSSFAFGGDSVANAVGLPMQVRRNAADDYGRMASYSWISHEGFGYLDTDSGIDAAQQTRVLEVRTTDVEV